LSNLDVVFVRGLEIEANHGYYEEERKTKRRFRVHVELSTNLRQASQSDSLPDTIDYFKVCQIIVDVGTSQTFKLLETLAGNIAHTLQDEYPTAAVAIEIEKLAPPCPGVPQSCGVKLHLDARRAGAKQVPHPTS
jgi:dihydroneopterin aldolase